MGLKKKSKVSAEFNMSSLTDIIFLLLIFFMLTSSLINPNALNLKLPSSSRVSTPSNKKLTKVHISNSGKYTIDRKSASTSSLDRMMRNKGKNASILVSWDKRANVEHVVVVMDLALKYHVNTVLAADK